ncbi:unnamed protein product [Schistosoma turkestanicum]|nr:unnamed protein product [Schistosoma turkestanicum]
MLRTLNSNIIDWMLPTGDIKAAFNDIPTGHTPTNTTDDNYKDFSKWENLNTPTPLDKESDNYFIYPPNSAIKVEPIEQEEEVEKNLQSRNNNSQLFETQYLKPFTNYRNDQTLYNRSQIPSSPIIYLDLESYQNTSNIEELKPETITSSSMLSQMNHSMNNNYNSDVMLFNHHWSTDSLLHSTKCCSNYTDSYHNTYTSISQTQTSWTTYHTHDMTIIPTTDHNNTTNNSNSGMIINQQVNYITPETTIPTCSTTFTISNNNNNNNHRTTLDHHKYDFNPSNNEYCFETTIQTNYHYNKQNQKLSTTTTTTDQQKPFVCNIQNCNKRFVRIDELKRHQRTHSGIKQFICDICKKGFTRSDHLMTHRRTHTGERPYECKLCDRRFARSDERNRHTKTHMHDKPRRGRKPKNESSGSLTMKTTTSLTPPTTITLSSSSSLTSSLKEGIMVVSTNFPTYNVHPSYSMPLDHHLSFTHRNNNDKLI